MNLINTTGLALIGPGSEWFWSMAQFFAVVVTLLGIYRQLKAQGASNALGKMQFLEDRWSSDRMNHVRLAAALSLKYGKPGAAMEPAMVAIADFWESIAGFMEDGHVRLVELEAWTRTVQMWWALLKPAIEVDRAIQHVPLYEGFEGLERLMRAYDNERGLPFLLDATTLPAYLDHAIRLNGGRLQIAQDFNAGVVPSAPKPVVATESA